MFADVCATGKPAELNANSGNIALAAVNAALRSIAQNGQLISLESVLEESRERLAVA